MFSIQTLPRYSSLLSLMLLVACARVAADAVQSPTLSPDIRLSFQDQYPDIKLESLGVSRAAWTMNGYALLARQRDSVEKFLSYTEVEIRGALERYMGSHPALSKQTGDLLILDMERPVNPQRIGDYGSDPDLQLQIISAFIRRIKVARDMFPNAKLSLFDVVGAPRTGTTDTAGFSRMMDGFYRAAALGMFDDLDFLSPSLYVQFGPKDRFFKTIEKYTKTKIEYTSKLKTSKGKDIPLAPFLGFKVQNKASGHHRECADVRAVSRQLRLLLQSPSVGIVVFWSGGVPSGNDGQCELPGFFEKLKSVTMF